MDRKYVPNGTVKASRPEPKTLADIMEEQITLHFPLQCDLFKGVQAPHTAAEFTDSPSILGAISTPTHM